MTTTPRSEKLLDRKRSRAVLKASGRKQFFSPSHHIRYLDMHTLDKEPVYCISILENFSRAILASGLSRRQDLPAYLTILYAAIRKHGIPEVLVSDSGGVFRAKQAQQIYRSLGIQKAPIQKRQAWQSYNVQRRLIRSSQTIQLYRQASLGVPLMESR